MGGHNNSHHQVEINIEPDSGSVVVNGDKLEVLGTAYGWCDGTRPTKPNHCCSQIGKYALQHNDRVQIGENNFYRYIDPEGTDGVVMSWDELG